MDFICLEGKVGKNLVTSFQACLHDKVIKVGSFPQAPQVPQVCKVLAAKFRINFPTCQGILSPMTQRKRMKCCPKRGQARVTWRGRPANWARVGPGSRSWSRCLRRWGDRERGHPRDGPTTGGDDRPELPHLQLRGHLNFQAKAHAASTPLGIIQALGRLNLPWKGEKCQATACSGRFLWLPNT